MKISIALSAFMLFVGFVEASDNIPKKWVGLSTGELPIKFENSELVGDNGSLHRVDFDGKKYIVLTHKLGQSEKVTGVHDLPTLKSKQYFIGPVNCKSKDKRHVAAIVDGSKNTEFFKASKAFDIDTENGTMKSRDPKGITCINEAYGL